MIRGEQGCGAAACYLTREGANGEVLVSLQ